MTADLTWLGSTILSRTLNEEECALLTPMISESSYSAGDTIIKTGQSGGLLHIMHSGTAKVEVLKDGEKPLKVADIEAGKLFGELTFLNNKPATADVIATEECVVYKLPREQLASVTQHGQPELAYLFFSAIMERQSGVIMEQHVALASEMRSQKKRGLSPTTMIAIMAIVIAAIIFITSS